MSSNFPSTTKAALAPDPVLEKVKLRLEEAVAPTSLEKLRFNELISPSTIAS